MNDTKKYFLSGAVIISFLGYSLHNRLDTLENVTITPIPTQIPSPPSSVVSSGIYKDGQYTGPVTDAYYGNIQVKAIISGGKLTDVQFLDYPQDRSTSRMINSQAMPYLTSEAIQAQSSQVDIVSGATDTSNAFIQSLSSALAQAKI